MAWFVAMTKPNHEGIAAANLQRQGFVWYCPKYLQKNKKPGFAPLVRPLFPRYIFVQLEKVWHSLHGTRGISYLLMAGDGPQLLPDTAINTIRAREDKDGFYQLVAPERFRKGQRVKCQQGPLAGLSLLYEGMTAHDRVKVLADLLGRLCVVEVEERLLNAA